MIIPMPVKMTEICRLARDEAKKAIAGTKEVYYKSGVWNEYTLCDTNRVLENIDKVPYGVDISLGEDGMYYVCAPSVADMW